MKIRILLATAVLFFATSATFGRQDTTVGSVATLPNVYRTLTSTSQDFGGAASDTTTSQAKIMWAPTLYEVTILSGTVKSAVLQLTSSADVSNASLFVTPEISSFVSISAVGNGTVLPGGQTASFQIQVAVPVSLGAGTYEGTIQLKSGNATIAKPLPVVIHVVLPSGSVVPTEGASPSPDRIITTSGGATFVKDEIDVIAADDTPNPDEVIKNIALSTSGVIIGSVPAGMTYQLQFNVADLQTLEKIRSQISGLPNIEAAIFSVFGGPVTTIPPNDPMSFGSAPFNQRWGLEFINAPSAWLIQTGDPNAKDPAGRPVAVVGVIDVDFDPDHTDLKSNIAASSGTRTLVSGEGAGHGTHVAGIIGAVGNNGIGITGVAWNVSLRLYDYGPLNTTELAPAWQTYQSMIRAAQDGARIVNISSAWPAKQPEFPSLQCPLTFTADETQVGIFARALFRKAIRLARTRNQDVLWVFSAGNACTDAAFQTPANLTQDFPENTITVAAIESNGNLASYSDFGGAVTVAAPGGPFFLGPGIFSTLPRICSFGGTSCDTGNYGYKSGTSQAAPYVAGLAALVRSEHPTFSATEIKHCIVSASLAVGSAVPGQSFNVINAPEAVRCSAATDVPIVTTLPATSITSTSAILNGTVNSNGTAGFVGFEIGTTPNLNNPANNAGVGSVAATSTPQSFSFTLSGALPNTTYYYRTVFCTGACTAFQTGNIVSVQTLPFVVTTLPATSITSTSAVLNGSINSNGTAGFAGFEIGTTANLNNPANSAGVGSVAATFTAQNFSFTFSGALPNTTYYYRTVFCTGACTVFQTGNVVSFQTLPYVVSTLPATSVTSFSAVLNGTINPNGTAGCAGFEIGTTSNLSNPGNSVGAGSVTATFTTQNFSFTFSPTPNLTQNTTYYYRTVFLPFCSGFAFQTGSVLSLTTPPLLTGLAVSTTSSTATITFITPVPANSQILYGTNGVYNNSDAAIGPVTTHTHILTNLQSGTTYNYQITVFVDGILLTSPGQTFVTH